MTGGAKSANVRFGRQSTKLTAIRASLERGDLRDNAAFMMTQPYGK
jgi:hypothetical protein